MQRAIEDNVDLIVLGTHGRTGAGTQERGADLIVIGVRSAAGHIGAAAHLDRATAHKVVAHAPCPVLTVRG